MKIKDFEQTGFHFKELISLSGYKITTYGKGEWFAYYGFKNKKSENGWQFGYHVNKQTPKYKTEAEAYDACVNHFETNQPRTRL